ncbi:MAG: N-acetylmuramoyl-L-alanine amidase [Candidatus Aminicenantes bacterium]|nr:N-acetylmuramoyl-L-alanine amidase [Candidatus Aminicenantes bacterium]
MIKRTSAFLILLAAAAAFAARGPVRLQNIRYYSYPEYTRVVLDLSGEVKIGEKVLKGGEDARLFFDLKNCRFAADYPLDKKSEIRIQAGNLQRIRLGQRPAQTLRVVFDFDRIGKYNRFYLTSPFRIVFDIYRQDEFVSRARQEPPPVAGGQGVPSIARQLGLGVHRIVIDPGHGGKDPGTSNRRLGLREKDITLDIAKRLNVILNEHKEFEIILTRPRDEYVPLEERAAIANSNQGDIFISIHTNSAPRQNARGVESYYLNITADPWAMEVAALENAMSSKSMADMRTILDQILKNCNISESRILTRFVQESMVANLKRKYDVIEDLGVKKAPFYVLLGAQMPSALVEVSFLSHPLEGRRLGTPEYRQTVAAGLYLGILNFIQSLGKK